MANLSNVTQELDQCVVQVNYRKADHSREKKVEVKNNNNHDISRCNKRSITKVYKPNTSSVSFYLQRFDFYTIHQLYLVYVWWFIVNEKHIHVGSC